MFYHRSFRIEILALLNLNNQLWGYVRNTTYKSAINDYVASKTNIALSQMFSYYYTFYQDIEWEANTNQLHNAFPTIVSVHINTIRTFNKDTYFTSISYLCFQYEFRISNLWFIYFNNFVIFNRWNLIRFIYRIDVTSNTGTFVEIAPLI